MTQLENGIVALSGIEAIASQLPDPLVMFAGLACANRESERDLVSVQSPQQAQRINPRLRPFRCCNELSNAFKLKDRII